MKLVVQFRTGGIPEKKIFPDHQTIVSILIPVSYETSSQYIKFLTSECNICFFSVYTHPERPIYNFANKFKQINRNKIF